MAVTAPPAAPPAPPPAPVAPDLGVRGGLRWMWRRLTSMRTALVLLLLLALATIPGSLLPQRSVDLGAVETFYADNPTLAPLLDGVGLFGVYASPWFGAVYLLLFISLVGCIVPRTRRHIGEWLRRPPGAPGRLGRLAGYQRYETALAPEDAAAAVAGVLRRRWHATVETGAGGTRIVAAQQGRLRETGNVIFHISMIGVLLALAGSALYSWRGEALVVEGGGFANTLPQYDSFTPGARYDAATLPPFALTLEDLDVRFESDQVAAFGAPRDFAATVTVTDTPGGPARREVIRVNSPVGVDGARLYLSGNGYAPVMQVRDAAGELTWEGAVPFLPQDGAYTSTGVVKVPDLNGTQDLALEGFFLPTAVMDGAGPRSIFPDAGNPLLLLNVSVGDLGLDTGRPASVFSLDGADLTQVSDEEGQPVSLMLAPGDGVSLPDGLGSVTFVELRRFVALDVRADPSGPLALIAAVLVMLGLAMSLFIPYRRVWVRLTPLATPGSGAAVPAGAVSSTAEPARTVVEVGGQSRSRDLGFGDVLARIDEGVRVAVPPAGRLAPVPAEPYARAAPEPAVPEEP